MRCIHCLSFKTVRNGYTEKGIQRYKCNDCGRRFCEKGFFARYRHKPKDIINTVYLRLKRQSLRETQDSVARLLYVHISYVTVYNWCMKFIKLLTLWASLIDQDWDKVWHIDEKFIKVRGSKDKFAYLFVAVDRKNKILATFVANTRTTESAKEILRRARKKKIPLIIVTDECQIYKKACKIFGRKVLHVKTHFKAKNVAYKGEILKLSNNKVERVNSDIDLFLHVFRGLKSFRTAEIWMRGFMIYHNYLKPSKINWHKIPKQIVSRRKIKINSIFYVILSPFNLTKPVMRKFFNLFFVL